MEPAGRHDLDAVDPELAPRILADEPEHQRVGERPWLGADVREVLHPHATLLGELALHCVLECLARLNEAGDRRVHSRGKPRGASKQALVAPPDQDDHRWREPWVDRRAAACTDTGVFGLARNRPAPAPPTEPVRCIEPGELYCTRGATDLFGRYNPVERPEPHRLERGGNLRIARQENCMDTIPIEPPDEEGWGGSFRR